MNITIEGILCAGGLVFGGACLGYAANTQGKLNELTNKLNVSVDAVLKEGKLDIPEEMIQEAVNRSVDRAASKQIGDAVREETKWVRSKAKEEIHHAVQSAVTNCTYSLEGDVKRELNKCLAEVNIDDIRAKVIDSAVERASKKFDQELQKVADSYAERMNTTNAIYSALSSRLDTNRDDTTIRLKIS